MLYNLSGSFFSFALIIQYITVYCTVVVVSILVLVLVLVFSLEQRFQQQRQEKQLSVEINKDTLSPDIFVLIRDSKVEQ